MFTGYVLVALLTIAANTFSGGAAIARFDWITPGMARAGMPVSWLIFPIGTLKMAGAIGLLLGLIDGVLTIRWNHEMIEGDLDVAGRGLVLVPTLFARGAITAIDPAPAPIVIYPARGRGMMAETEPPRMPGTLDRLLGSPHARLLVMLEYPGRRRRYGRIGGVPHRRGGVPGGAGGAEGSPGLRGTVDTPLQGTEPVGRRR